MTDAGGGFYSSQDADSEGEEGKFFVWSRQEILDVMGERHGNLFCDFFDVTESGNFEGQNILHINASITDTAARNKVSAEDLQAIIDSGRQKLFARREQRVKPGRDQKVLTAWNGLMLAGFAEASAILERMVYCLEPIKMARQN